MRHLTKSQLIRAAQLAEKHDYNRQLETTTLRRLPDRKYPILDSFIHTHRHFRPCQPHLRLLLQLPTLATAGQPKPECVLVSVDVPMTFARALHLAAWSISGGMGSCGRWRSQEPCTPCCFGIH